MLCWSCNHTALGFQRDCTFLPSLFFCFVFSKTTKSLIEVKGFLIHHVLLCISKLVPQTHSHTWAIRAICPLKFVFCLIHKRSNIQLCVFSVGQYTTVGLQILLWYCAVWIFVCVSEKCLIQLCGAEVFVPWDLSLKELRWCKPSKRVIQDHTLQRLSSQRLYLHHISPPLPLIPSPATFL